MGVVRKGPSAMGSLRHDARVARSLIRNLLALRMLRKEGREVVVFARIGRLGDLVQCEPMVRQLREAHPRAAIVQCVSPRFLELAEASPDLEAALPVTCLCEARLIGRSPGIFRFVDAHPPGERWGECRRTGKGASGASESADDFPRHPNRLHAFQRIAGLPERDDASRVHVTARARGAVDALGLPPRFVAMNCRSMDTERNWTDEGWNDLARAIGCPVVEIGWGHPPTIRNARDLCGKTGILEAAEVIRRSALFVGVDSGPAHLANAVGTQGVILVGNHRRYPADVFENVRMYNGRYADAGSATLLKRESLAEIESAEVIEAVRDRLSHGS